MIIIKKKTQQNNEIKKQTTPLDSFRPQSKAKTKGSNLKQPSIWVQIDTEERCSRHRRKNKIKNATEKKPTACHATGHTTGSGARNEDMNFCVNMVKCTVCMSVYDYICCHYMRGGYHVCLVKGKGLQLALFRF